MKKTILTIALIAVATVAAAQMKWNSAFQQYIDQYKDLAIEQMKKYRIPASITLAQGVFESGAGRSDLARKGNNHFTSSATDGRAGQSVPTTTRLTSVSVPTTTRGRATRTTRAFSSTATATASFSHSPSPTTADGHEG